LFEETVEDDTLIGPDFTLSEKIGFECSILGVASRAIRWNFGGRNFGARVSSPAATFGAWRRANT
jgi:hypothetical protein